MSAIFDGFDSLSNGADLVRRLLVAEFDVERFFESQG